MRNNERRCFFVWLNCSNLRHSLSRKKGAEKFFVFELRKAFFYSISNRYLRKLPKRLFFDEINNSGVCKTDIEKSAQ
jgi:hypothetical protein